MPATEFNNNKDKTDKNLKTLDLTGGIPTELRRGRSRKYTFEAPKRSKTPKAPKTKRVTLKAALALASATIPDIYSTPPNPSVAGTSKRNGSSQKPPPQQPSEAIPARECDIDLTGDVVLTDQHSSAPLFEKPKIPKLEYSIDDDDDMDVLKIKIKYKESIRGISHRRHQRYYDLFKTISEQENIPMRNIFLHDGDKRILHDDTPHNTGYKITTILICRVMETKAGSDAFQQATKKDHIELKFQSDKWKRPLIVKMSKLDNFKTAISILCEQINFTPDQISLSFDGDAIALNDTPVDLEFDGGEILDCRVKI